MNATSNPTRLIWRPRARRRLTRPTMEAGKAKEDLKNATDAAKQAPDATKTPDNK